ncbi:MAG: hypothetical protein E7613_01295 [Ruminococcaceae bacterium]|nr:hypothetical protein [Oscillospiraceae bacterium]
MPIFINRASLSYNNTVTNSNTVTGNLIETLSVTKTAVADTYSRGDSITYLVNVLNSGNTAYNALTVTDNLGAYTDIGETYVPLTYSDGSLLYYLNGVLQPTPTVTSGDTLVISGINIPAGGSALLVYQAEANEFSPLDIDGNITNIVTVTGASVSESVTASATVTPENEASLSISKAICPSVVTENGQLTYTFVIQNTGNTATVATDDLIVTDVFDPILNNIVVTYNDDVLTEGTDYTYINGTFTTASGIVSVPAATYTRGEDGTWIINPGVSVITVTGTV